MLNRDHIRRVFAAPKKKRHSSKPRRPLTTKQKEEVLKKTGGRCHLCGSRLNDDWHVDHLKPHSHGGKCFVKNCLPICVECNGLKWSYKPEVIRLMLHFGRVAKKEIRGGNPTRKPTPLGEQLIRRLMADR